MKRVSLIISSVVLLGILVTHTSCKNDKSSGKTISSGSNSGNSSIIAYVDIDSFEANYKYLKDQRERFSTRQQAMQTELQRSAQQLQTDMQLAQQKAQSGNMTEAEGAATEKKLMQMQQSLQLREQSLTQQLLKEKDEFNNKLHKDLDDFLKEYNKDKKYDYILSYSSVGSQILFANPTFDITDDVIEGMNKRAENIKDSDTTKKK